MADDLTGRTLTLNLGADDGVAFSVVANGTTVFTVTSDGELGFRGNAPVETAADGDAVVTALKAVLEDGETQDAEARVVLSSLIDVLGWYGFFGPSGE